MKDFEKYATENGFGLQLGRWDFVYTEDQRRLTLPVEMLAHGDFLWEFPRSSIKTWDSPQDNQHIDEDSVARISERITRYVELTGKRVRIY